MQEPMNASPGGCTTLTRNDLPVSACPSLTQRARAMAEEYKVSVRTAYRHLARGTAPTADRRIGMDGKTYPANPWKFRPGRTPVERELALTRQALNRADKKACEQGIAIADVVTLRRIVATASEMLNRWEGVHSM